MQDQDLGDEVQVLAGVTAEKLAAVEATDGVAGLAGRELDAAVAERVMGWVWRSRAVSESRRPGPAWLFSPESKEEDTGEKGLFGEPLIVREFISGPFREYDGGSKSIAGNVPHYSTNIAAAMEVLKKFPPPHVVTMEKDRWFYNSKTDEGWKVVITVPKRSPGYAIYASLPEAICRAALAATT